MPVYEYKCQKCGKEFEFTQRITENALEFCPEAVCEEAVKGIGSVERKISKNIGLVFKGSGFYLTDYARKTNNFPKSTNSSSDSEPVKSDAKTEPVKTETKAEPAKSTAEK